MITVIRLKLGLKTADNSLQGFGAGIRSGHGLEFGHRVSDMTDFKMSDIEKQKSRKV